MGISRMDETIFGECAEVVATMIKMLRHHGAVRTELPMKGYETALSLVHDAYPAWNEREITFAAIEVFDRAMTLLYEGDEKQQEANLEADMREMSNYGVPSRGKIVDADKETR